MKKYSGRLGNFIFDEKMFELRDGNLIYIGGTTKGCIKCQIPEGILFCDRMFQGNKQLKVGPVLPKSCVSANFMFADCSHLIVYPDINQALMESDLFDWHTMFLNCTDLEKLSVDTNNSRKIEPYVCACETSLDYQAHVSKMNTIIQSENQQQVEDWKVHHWLRMKMNKVSDDEIKKVVPQFNPVERHNVQFFKDSKLVTILEARHAGKMIGIEVERKSTTKKIKKQEQVKQEDLSSDTMSPEKIRIE